MLPTIKTFSGVYFDLANPTPEQIRIEDIAHALAHLCRFNGHSSEFYSVAQHSVFVSRRVPEELALWGLLHDASEAYIGDMSAPLKLLCPDFRQVERAVMGAICLRFDLPLTEPPRVKEVDRELLAAEQRDLMQGGGEIFDPWIKGVDVPEMSIVGWHPPVAKMWFLRRFEELTR